MPAPYESSVACSRVLRLLPTTSARPSVRMKSSRLRPIDLADRARGGVASSVSSGLRMLNRKLCGSVRRNWTTSATLTMFSSLVSMLPR